MWLHLRDDSRATVIGPLGASGKTHPCITRAQPLSTDTVIKAGSGRRSQVQDPGVGRGCGFQGEVNRP